MESDQRAETLEIHAAVLVEGRDEGDEGAFDFHFAHGESWECGNGPRGACADV
jgi:hypothetical protein